MRRSHERRPVYRCPDCRDHRLRRGATMTAPAPPVTRLRCPREECGHFPNRIEPHSELIAELGEWRHAIYAEDDKGHTWTTSWNTTEEKH